MGPDEAHRHLPGPSYPDLPGTGTPVQRRALRIALVLNAVFLVAEVAGGIVFSSLALLADAAHMLTDVGALSLALVAFRLAERPASARHSYGLQRAELLAALANGLALLAISAWVTVEAIRRLADPPPVAGGGLLVVAAGGLAVNAVSAWLVARSQAPGGRRGVQTPRSSGGRRGVQTPHSSRDHANLNVHGAFLHLATDAAGSVAAMVAGAAMLLAGAAWVDPVASLVIVALVAASGWRLLRDVTHILLEGTPRHLDPGDVAAALHAEPAVERVHHLHVWRLSSGSVALSAHVVTPSVATLHEAQLVGDRLKTLLAERFGIDHATIELECHDCRGQRFVTLDPRPSAAPAAPPSPSGSRPPAAPTATPSPRLEERNRPQ
jgi:cobalt-zinc-cadmium efflux system protein